MRAELANVDWGHRLVGRMAEEQWRIFKEIFFGTQQKYILMVKKDCKRRDNQPWLSKEIRESIKLKADAFRVAKSSGRVEDWERFKNQQRMTKKLIKKGRIDYEAKLALNIKKDRKSFYKYIKRRRLARVNVGP